MARKEINIFYTDDDGDDIAFFKDAVNVASKEVNVIATFDGGSLMELLNNPPPEPAVVFLDWNMPGQSGADVLEEIRSTENLKTLPVVIFSTSDSHVHIQSSRRLGANMYITKPTSFQEIVKVLKYCFTIDWQTFVADDTTYVYKIA